jgi:hypothetical protein
VGDFSVEISGVRSLVLGVFGESEAGGTGLLGVLGTGARISLWYPGAREPNRLLLAGKEENSVLGSILHSFNFSIGPTEQRDLASEACIFIYELLSYFHVVDKF